MGKGKAQVALGALVAALAIFASAADILGYSGGAGDGDKVPPGCASCHASPGSGTVAITTSNANAKPGEGLNITVTVTEQSLTGDGIVGVFLLKGPAGTQESVTNDGWTIVRDPNGGTHNYAEKTGLSTGVPATFVWALSAPSATGTYTVYANVKHGGDGPASEISAPASITVSTPVEEGSAPPVIWDPSYPAVAATGSVPDISVRITDDLEGVSSASVHWKTPGGANFTELIMAKMDGTALDGNWSISAPVGQAPGALEFYLTATDGKKESRRPANGALVISVVSTGAPEIGAPTLPKEAELDSTIRISARMTDGNQGMRLVVARYRMPGDADFTTREMRLVNGTNKDGEWMVEIGTGSLPGAMEMYLAATDGQNDARSPGSGSYTVLIVKPEGPALEVAAPASVTFRSNPDVRARASDPLGVVGVRVSFKQDDEASYRVLEMTMRSGNDKDGEWFASLPVGNATGEYSFFVLAKSSRSESQSEAQTVKVLPDLSVSRIAFSQKGIIVKDEVVIRAVIENRGDRAVTGLSVSILDLSYSVGDVQFIRRASNVTVPANGNVTVSANWVPQVDGKRQIAVVVDPDKKVEEGNEDNNGLVTTVPVGLEPGMGIRFPIPTLGDIWVQLTMILTAAAVVGTSIFYGHINSARRIASAAANPRHKGPGRMPNKGG